MYIRLNDGETYEGTATTILAKMQKTGFSLYGRGTMNEYIDEMVDHFSDFGVSIQVPRGPIEIRAQVFLDQVIRLGYAEVVEFN